MTWMFDFAERHDEVTLHEMIIPAMSCRKWNVTDMTAHLHAGVRMFDLRLHYDRRILAAIEAFVSRSKEVVLIRGGSSHDHPDVTRDILTSPLKQLLQDSVRLYHIPDDMMLLQKAKSSSSARKFADKAFATLLSTWSRRQLEAEQKKLYTLNWYVSHNRFTAWFRWSTRTNRSINNRFSEFVSRHRQMVFDCINIVIFDDVTDYGVIAATISMNFIKHESLSLLR